MIHHLYHSVIPNKKNRFKPHILRAEVLAIALLLLWGIQLNYNVALGSGKLLGYATNISASQLQSLTNQERAAQGLNSLAMDSRLNSAALAKANDMVAKDYWAHTSPSGKEPWEFIVEAGYSYSHAGENLAYGFMTSAGTMTGWMNSPGHRANILSDKYSEVGFAVVNSSSFQGGENTLVVAMYAHPYGAPAPSSGGSEPAPQTQTSPELSSAPAASPSQIMVDVCRNGELTSVPDTLIYETDSEPPCDEPEPEPEPALSVEEDEDDDAALTIIDYRPDALPQPTESAPTTDYQITEPGFVLASLSWPAVTGAGFLGTASMASFLRHIHFWQHHKPKHMIHWLKTHPVFQTLALVGGLLAILSSGIGVVG